MLDLFKNKAIVDLDGRQQVLTVGRSSPEGVVLVSVNSEEAILEINGSRNACTLGSSIGNMYKAPKGNKTVSIAPDGQRIHWVNGSINDFLVRFVVDMGTTIISMNKHQAKCIGIDYKMKDKKSIVNTASRLDIIYIVDLKKIEN